MSFSSQAPEPAKIGAGGLPVMTPRTDYTGVILVTVSLVADAFHSSTQESVLHKYQASIIETALFSNLFAAGCCLVYLVFTGELWAALLYCGQLPITYVLFIIRAFVIYCGVLCFTALIKRFDVVVATTVTTIRKILTILLSFLLFPKPWSFNYVYGTLSFLASLALSVYQGRQRRSQ